ncbi:MAG: hypothetical protein AB7Y46_09440 [Armatimonadota bacterium]
MLRAISSLGALIAVSAVMAQELPNPYQRSEQPTIGPAPVPVMEQMFWVQVKLDPATPVEVTAPEGVTLLDRTKPGQGGGWSRFYFRSDRGITDGEIVLAPAGAASVRVPLTVRTYREDLAYNVAQVPGIDPTQRKRGRAYYTDEMLAIARENLAAHPELGDDIKRATRYDALADEEVFAALPSWTVPRQCYSNWPCPYCGEAIFRHSGFYPWRADTDRPWKLQCPDCGRWFPSNDWANDDFTSGEHPDDGWGFPMGEAREDHAGWVAYYNHHLLWQMLGAELRRLSLRYLLFGDEQAAHKVGLLLARMAYVYPGMNMRWQQVDDHYLRPGRLLVDGNWERGQVLVPACQAYDAVWEYLGEDQALADFLHTKDPTINTPDDVRALIDVNLIQVFGFDWLRRELSGGAMGARETDLAYMAVCADMGPVTDRWIEELFTHAWSSGLDKGGFDDETLINTMTREGPVWIAALGYAYGYLPSKSDMAEILARVQSQQWGARCNLYDEAAYPKLRAEFDAWPNMIVAGQFGPSYGDSGGGQGARYPNGIVANLKQAYMRAYRRWPTDTIARALYRAGKPQVDLFEPNVWDQVVAHAERIGPAQPLTSRVMDGVGFVFLESRADAEDLNQRAGLALRYGYGRGHHHHDNLNVELFALGQDMTPELGYPCWAHPMGNTGFVAHHITGMIDRRGQYNSAISHGTLELFAGAPEASFADVSAEPDGFPNRFYRRAICLADAPGGNVYVFDVLRLAGGTQRTWCFHGPPVGGFESSLVFAPTGDAALPLNAAIGRGLENNIVEPAAAQADADAWADWAYLDQDLHLRVDLLGAAGRRYITARCAKPDIPPLRYLFAEDQAEDGASEFVSLWQPYRSQAGPFVQRIERLLVAGDVAEGEFAPVAVRVTLAGGQVDTFIYSLDPEAELTIGDLQFCGSFGYWSELNGEPRAAHLVGGRYLRRGETGLSVDRPRVQATITEVDLATNTITLDRPLPGGETLVGQVIYLQGGPHRTAYHVAEVLDGGARLRLDLNSIIFRSKIESFAEDGSYLVSELPPSIEAGRGFKPGYYDGALITGEDLRARYRVDHVEEEAIFADRPLNPADFPDADGDGRVTLRIYDHGPGDTATMVASRFERWQ